MWLVWSLACGAPTEPVWALDPTWVEPTADGLHGFETWNLYDARWERNRSERAFVCSVVVSVDGVATEADCPECTVAFTVTPSFLESDCDGDLPDDPGFLTLSRLALGAVGPNLVDDDPFPGQSVGGYADYGDGWVPHGWAYPDALDLGQTVDDSSWDGDQAFEFWPAFVWDLSAR
jgi:hypothetical protein